MAVGQAHAESLQQFWTTSPLNLQISRTTALAPIPLEARFGYGSGITAEKCQWVMRSISGGGSASERGDGRSLWVGSIRSERDYTLSGGKDSISQPQNRIFDYLRHRDPNCETSDHISQKPLVRPLRNA